MSDVEIVYPVPVEEVPGWLATLETTFLEKSTREEFERWVQRAQRNWALRRNWGARADGRWVATLATEPRHITVPGTGTGTNEVLADALTAVTVNATHRRRGLLTRMLGQSLEQAHERGDALSILIAAEWPIYGRFGYAPASQCAAYTYHPRQAAVSPGPHGSVRQVDAEEFGSVATDLFDRARRARAGQVDRPGRVWSRRLGIDGYPPPPGKQPNLYLHETDGVPDGMLAWSGTRDAELNGPQGAVNVSDLATTSDLAYRNLWAYLGSLDLVDEVTLGNRPVDEPVRWLLADGRALRASNVRDDVWVRLLDVPAALTARRYATSGRVVLEVHDTDGGYAAGRFALDSDGGDCSCQPTREQADLVLSQRCLASVYLGGGGLDGWRLSGDVQERTSGALARTAAMFASYQPPWNATGF